MNKLARILCLLYFSLPSDAYAARPSPYIPIFMDGVTIFIPNTVIVVTNIEDISDTSATITWSTDVTATSEVLVGQDQYISSPTLFPPSGDYVPDEINHSIQLSGLSPETMYYFKVDSFNSNNQLVYSTISNFKTLPTPASPDPDSSDPNSSVAPSLELLDVYPYAKAYYDAFVTGQVSVTRAHVIRCMVFSMVTSECIGRKYSEYHDRLNIGHWRPVYGPGTGLRPAYATGSGGMYFTNWYIELLNQSAYQYSNWCDAGVSPSECDVEKNREIWPGEYWNGWGILPTSSDLMVSGFFYLIPDGMEYGVDYVVRNFPVPIDPSTNRTVSGSFSTCRESATSSFEECEAKIAAEISQLKSSGALNDYRGFSSPDGAALEVLRLLTPISAKYNRELGGNIVPYSGPYFRYTIRPPGTANSINIPTSSRGYHTHPDYTPKFSNWYTSGPQNDLNWLRAAHYDSYLGTKTPNGPVEIYICEYLDCRSITKWNEVDGATPTRRLQ